MEFEELFTSRLILRKITPKVFDYIYKDLSETEQMKFLGLDTKEALITEIKKYKLGLSTYNKQFLYFQMMEPKNREIIGWCGYHTWYLDHDRAEIGYGLFKDELKGKGLMTEALSSIIKYGFIKMNLNRIEAFVSEVNIASVKLIENLNFVKEGKLRKHYFFNNRYEDSTVYSLLKEEFKKK